jgi:hypothetical protein
MLKKFTTITIAAAASLGALALSAPSASAGYKGHGFHVGFHGGHGWGHRHWRHRHWGYGFYRPVIYSSYSDCYYVRRRGVLFKICD